MKVKKLELKNFRNYESQIFEFDDNVNIIHGFNAQGKTNAVEGIYHFSRGKSFRGREDKELIKFSEKGFHIGIEYESKKGNEKLEYSLYENEKQRKKNGYKVTKIREIIGSFRSVLFSPDDLLLVKESPEKRREFMNVAISQYSGAYIGIYANYKKALENRNHILKSAQKGIYLDYAEFESWSDYMAEIAALIYDERKRFVEKTEKYAKDIMKDISSGKEEIELIYKSDIETQKDDIKEEYKRIFKDEYKREIAAGTSLFGSQRDDIEILINGKPARNFASQGQQRSIVLSLKLAEGEINRENFGEYPVFLFDDVLSELDEGRRGFLLSGLSNRQIIMTSCECDTDKIKPERIITVSGGKYLVGGV